MRVHRAKMLLVLTDHTQENLDRLLSFLESSGLIFDFELCGEERKSVRLEIFFGAEDISSRGSNIVNLTMRRILEMTTTSEPPKPAPRGRTRDTRTPYERQQDFEEKLRTPYGMPPE